jgi:hypothetical protein
MKIVFFFALQLLLGIATYICAVYNINQVLLISGILAIPLYGIMAYFEMKRERWIFSPLVVFLGISVLYIGSASIWAFLCDYWETDDVDVFTLGMVDVYDNRVFAVAFAIIGSAFFYLGYHVVLNTRLDRIAKFVGSKTPDFMIPFPVWLIIIGGYFILRKANDLLGLNLGQLGSLYTNSCIFTTIGTFIVLTSNVSFQRGELVINPAGWRIFLALLIGLADLRFFALRSGMRYPMLQLLIFIFWGYLLQNNIFSKKGASWREWFDRSKSALILMVFAFITVVVILPFGKQIARGEEAPTQVELANTLVHWKDSFPREGIWSLSSRMAVCSINALGACIELRSMVPPDKTVFDVVSYGVVPRLFWPDKPWVSRGGAFTNFLDPSGSFLDDETEAISSTGMTAIGELYWSYGMAGLCIGMFLIGLTYAFTFNVFSLNMPLNPIRYLVSSLLVVNSFMWFEGEASTIYVNMIFIWVVFFPMLWLFNFWLPLTSAKRVRKA